MSNPVLQFQIKSKSPDETAKFYGALFGWRIDADNALGYRIIRTGDAGITHGLRNRNVNRSLSPIAWYFARSRSPSR
jgi:predicted enzyme related to lactoylglutathione lyase